MICCWYVEMQLTFVNNLSYNNELFAIIIIFLQILFSLIYVPLNFFV